MKKLVVVLAVAFSGVSFSQDYSAVTQAQKKFLDTYNIDYIGLHTRYIMSSNLINSITHLPSKKSMIVSFSKFMKWNNGSLQVVPDTNIIIETGDQYISQKLLDEYNEPLYWILNESHKILQKISFDINKDGIKTIEIIEYHIAGEYPAGHPDNDKFYSRVGHLILVENYDNVWSMSRHYENDLTLDCPKCPY